jgi:hypothetical protein
MGPNGDYVLQYAFFSQVCYSAQSGSFAMLLSHLRCFAQWARRGGICRHHGDDSIVRIVKIAGRDGPEYRQLLRGILVAEYVSGQS